MAELLERTNSSYFPSFKNVFRDVVAGNYFPLLYCGMSRWAYLYVYVFYLCVFETDCIVFDHGKIMISVIDHLDDNLDYCIKTVLIFTNKGTLFFSVVWGFFVKAGFSCSVQLLLFAM